LGLHTKPVGLLNINGYFSPLLAMIERARNEKFIYDEHRDLLVSSDRPLDLLDLLENFKSPSGLDRWVNR